MVIIFNILSKYYCGEMHTDFIQYRFFEKKREKKLRVVAQDCLRTYISDNTSFYNNTVVQNVTKPSVRRCSIIKAISYGRVYLVLLAFIIWCILRITACIGGARVRDEGRCGDNGGGKRRIAYHRMYRTGFGKECPRRCLLVISINPRRLI